MMTNQARDASASEGVRVTNRQLLRIVVFGACLIGTISVRAQNSTAIDRARRVIDSLANEQFEAVAKEFNTQMRAALPLAALEKVWTTPTEYARAGQIPDAVLDDIAN